MRDASQYSGGYIRLYRSLLSWEWFQDSATLHVFVFLLLSACFRPIRHAGVDLAPGQLITARSQIAARTGLTENQVRTALGHLKSTGEITVESNSRFSLITITKFARYQGLFLPASSPAAHQPPTSGSPQKKQENPVNHEKKKGMIPHDRKHDGNECSDGNAGSAGNPLDALGLCL